MKRENRSSGTTFAQDREKRTGQSKSHKSVIFHVVGRRPHPTDLGQNLRGGCRPGRNHVFKVWDWNF